MLGDKKILFGNKLGLDKWIKIGENSIAVEFVFGNQNKTGSFHSLGTGSRFFAVPETFEMTDWKDGKSPQYRDVYKFLKLDCFGLNSQA